MAGVGDPVVVTVNEPAVPTVNVVLLELVIVGAVPVAVTVKPNPPALPLKFAVLAGT
jgi:hypothetical protein